MRRLAHVAVVAALVVAVPALADVRSPRAAAAETAGARDFASTIPAPPPSFVWDGADVLTPAEQQQLEQRVLELDRRTGVQIGVAIFESLQGEDVESATLQVAERWKPGHAGKDDGVLLAFYVKDRKLRIETGYGIEGSLPDATANRIITEQIAPRLRSGDWSGGITAGVESIALAATGQPLPPPARAQGARGAPVDKQTGNFVLCCILPAIFFLVMSSMFRRRRPRHFRRGYASGGLPWWAWLLIGNTLGRPSHHRRGGWGGGGFGGGGFGGGGGGFGGGSFGGGGASGSW